MHCHSQTQFPYLQNGFYIINFTVYNEERLTGITGKLPSIVFGRCRYFTYPMATIISHTIYFIANLVNTGTLLSIDNYKCTC